MTWRWKERPLERGDWLCVSEEALGRKDSLLSRGGGWSPWGCGGCNSCLIKEDTIRWVYQEGFKHRKDSMNLSSLAPLKFRVYNSWSGRMIDLADFSFLFRHWCAFSRHWLKLKVKSVIVEYFEASYFMDFKMNCLCWCNLLYCAFLQSSYI